MIAYKLLTQEMTSFGGCLWTLNEWKETSGEGELCDKGWLHGYEHPLLAVLHNPIFGDFENPRLFEAEVEGIIKRDGYLKFGCTRMRILKEIPLPKIMLEQKIKYGILCSLEVYHAPEYVAWANDWLSGKDRSAGAARAAARAAEAAEAAWAAARAARAAAEAAARAAWAAWAAWAAEAAWVASISQPTINLIAIAEKACEKL